jgi:hypothetical protein
MLPALRRPLNRSLCRLKLTANRKSHLPAVLACRAGASKRRRVLNFPLVKTAPRAILSL